MVNLYASLISLFYIRYFEISLWGDLKGNSLLYLYKYIAIPVFYFSLAIPFCNILFSKFISSVPIKLKRFILYCVETLWTSCFVYFLLGILGVFQLPLSSLSFYSIFNFIFCAGISFSLTQIFDNEMGGSLEKRKTR